MSKMRPYRLLPDKKHYEGGKLLEAGAVVRLTDSRHEGLKDRFVPAGDDVEATETGDGYAFLAGLPWRQAASAISAMETAQEVEAALESEREGANRDSVIKAGQERLAELEGDGE